MGSPTHADKVSASTLVAASTIGKDTTSLAPARLGILPWELSRTPSNAARNEALSGGPAACNVCHPPLSAERQHDLNLVRVRDAVRQVALELMAKHKANVTRTRDSFVTDQSGKPLGAATKQMRVDQAVGAARAIESLKELDELLGEDERDLRWLGAEARRSGNSFDREWIDRLRQHALMDNKQQFLNRFSDKSAISRIQQSEVEIRLDLEKLAEWAPTTYPPANANSVVQFLAGQYSELRREQRAEVFANIGALYKMFPFFGTDVLPSRLVRIADAPVGTVVPPENQIGMGYASLLMSIDEAIEKIRSNDIDSLDLPEAVRIAVARMDSVDKGLLDELFEDKKRREDDEFLLSLSLPFLLALLPLLAAGAATAVGASAAGLSAATEAELLASVTAATLAADAAEIVSLAGGAVGAASGGLSFKQSAEEHSNRLSLEAASGSHDRSLLGVPAISGNDIVVLLVDGIFAAAGLVGTVTGGMAHVESMSKTKLGAPGGPSSPGGLANTERLKSTLERSPDESSHPTHRTVEVPEPYALPLQFEEAPSQRTARLTHEVAARTPPVSDDIVAPRRLPIGMTGPQAPTDLSDVAMWNWMERREAAARPVRQAPWLMAPGDEAPVAGSSGASETRPSGLASSASPSSEAAPTREFAANPSKAAPVVNRPADAELDAAARPAGGLGRQEMEWTADQLERRGRVPLGPNALGGLSPAQVALGARVEWDYRLGVMRAVEFNLPGRRSNVDALGINTRKELGRFAKGQSPFSSDDFTKTKGERAHIIAQANSASDIQPDLGLPGLEESFAAQLHAEIAEDLMQMHNVWFGEGQGPTGANQGALRAAEDMLAELKGRNLGASICLRIEATFADPPRTVTSPKSGKKIPVPEEVTFTATLVPSIAGQEPRVLREVVVKNAVGGAPKVVYADADFP